jgi:hypothetical protein
MAFQPGLELNTKLAEVEQEAGITPPSTASTLYDVERHEFLPNPSSKVPATPGRSSSTNFLDGLRGLAAVFVFIQHYVGGFDLNVHEHGFGENGNYYIASLPVVRLIFSGGSAAVAILVSSTNDIILGQDKKC